jgi:putative hydrolase of the HAD superfamily
MVRAVIFDLGNTLIYQEPDIEKPIDQLPFVPTPDASAVLHDLAARYRLAIISNMTTSRESNVRRALESVGWNEIISTVVTSVDIGCRKPSKEIFVAALDSLGVSPAGAIMIGNDVVADMGGAARADIGNIFYSCNEDDWIALRASDIAPDYTARKLSEVVPIIDCLNRS